MSEKKQQTAYPLRMPDHLRNELEDAAKSGKRSLNAEIVARLEASFAMSIPPAGARVEDLEREYFDVSSQCSNVQRTIFSKGVALEQLQKQHHGAESLGKAEAAIAIAALIESTKAEIAALDAEYTALRDRQAELNSKLNASIYISDLT